MFKVFEGQKEVTTVYAATIADAALIFKTLHHKVAELRVASLARRMWQVTDGKRTFEFAQVS